MGGFLTGDPRWKDDQERERSYEETLVKRILASRNLPYHAAQAAQEAQALGDTGVSFAWLHWAYPGFPVQLAAARLRYTHQITVGDLFGPAFAKQKFFQEYQQAAERLTLDLEEERLGLVFNWAGIKTGGGAMILHNYPQSLTADPNHREERGTRIVRTYGKPPVTYVIEAFGEFLLSLGEWPVA